MAIYGHANTVADLHQILRQVLQPYLGAFQNGRSAIAVEPPTVPIAGTGLHVYIQRQPLMITPTAYRWDVTFVLYGDDYIKWDDAIAAIRSRFPRRSETILPHREGHLARASFGLIFERFAYPQY